MKLKLPSWATVGGGVIAAVLAALNQTSFGLGQPWQAYVTAALGFLAGLGISPLVGPAFQSAIHLSAKAGAAISTALTGLAVGATTLSVSPDVKGILVGVITFAQALGFAPAISTVLAKYKPVHKFGLIFAPIPEKLKDLSAYLLPNLSSPPSVVMPPSLIWPMDGNEKYGDCTIAGIAHLIQLWNKIFSRSLKVPSLSEITATYFKLTGGPDSGLILSNVLEAFKKTGLFGEKIKLYAPVNPRNVNLIKQSISLYGAIYLGISCPQSMEEQFANGEHISYVPGSPSLGGHCIIGVGYNGAGVWCVTWGKLVFVTWEFLAHELQEGWVIFPQQLVEAGQDKLGIDDKALEADLELV